MQMLVFVINVGVERSDIYRPPARSKMQPQLRIWDVIQIEFNLAFQTSKLSFISMHEVARQLALVLD
jgi:hypothetical protein